MSKKDEEKIAKHLALFDGPDAQKKVLSHAKRYALCEKAQVKIFELPNAMDVLRAYIQHDPLCDKAELKMVAHPDAKKFLREYQALAGSCILSLVESFLMISTPQEFCPDSALTVK